MDKQYPRFPLFIDLSGRKVVIVGGGTVASRRAATLQTFGADVTLIAPEWENQSPNVTWHQRRYRPGDLAGATLAVAATDDRAVNAAVGEEANRSGVPVSVADDPSACTFYFPAICMGEALVAGVVSKDGTQHQRTAKAAKTIRQTLEELP